MVALVLFHYGHLTQLLRFMLLKDNKESFLASVWLQSFCDLSDSNHFLMRTKHAWRDRWWRALRVNPDDGSFLRSRSIIVPRPFGSSSLYNPTRRNEEAEWRWVRDSEHLERSPILHRDLKGWVKCSELKLRSDLIAVLLPRPDMLAYILFGSNNEQSRVYSAHMRKSTLCGARLDQPVHERQGKSKVV